MIFWNFYEGSRQDTIETSAIKRYIQNYQITRLPVDIDENELIVIPLKSDIIELKDVVYNNFEFYKLQHQLRFLSEQHGFHYLNSAYCKEIMKYIWLMEENILEKINHKKLFQTRKIWLNIMCNPDNEMINTINNYSVHNKYNKALFLNGAEHRESIIDKLSKFAMNNKPELNCVFNYLN